MKSTRFERLNTRRLASYVAVFGVGLVLAQVSETGWALRAAPTKHQGVSVESLGVVSEASMSRQLGLEGHIMQLREITLAPAGYSFSPLARPSTHEPDWVHTSPGRLPWLC